MLQKRIQFLSDSKELITSKISTIKLDSDPVKLARRLQDVHDEWKKLLDSEQQGSWDKLNNAFIKFHSGVMKPQSGIPDKVKVAQGELRFVRCNGDSNFVVLAKTAKQFGLGTQELLARIGLLGKKKKKEGVRWKHDVALNDLNCYVFGVDSFQWTGLLFYEILKRDIEGLEQVFNYYEGLFRSLLEAIANGVKESGKVDYDVENTSVETIKLLDKRQESLHLFLKELDNQINEEFESSQYLLESLFKKAGTVELPNSAFNHKVIDSRGRTNFHRHHREFERWKNSRLALGDDWALSDEVFEMDLQSVIRVEELIGISNKRVRNEILNKLDELDSYLKEVRTQLKNSTTKSGLSSELKKLSYQAKKKLENHLITDLVDAVINQNFAGLVSGIENNLNQYIDKLSDKRSIANAESYAQPLGSDKISRIDPREIVRYSVQPVLNRDMAGFTKSINKLQAELIRKASNIGQTLKFGLEAGIDQVKSSDEELDVILKNLDDAMERTIGRSTEFRELSNKLEETFIDESRTLAGDLISGTSFLTINQNVIDLRIKLVRAKALERSRTWRKNIRSKAVSFIKQGLVEIRKAYHYVRDKVFQVQKFTGITSSAAANSKISVFLTRSWNSINELPYFYQRLFNLDPVTDPSLFTGRQKEAAAVKYAYDLWLDGAYSNIAVIGEIGSGKTSLVNNFLQKNEIIYPVKRMKLTSVTDKPSDIYSFFCKALEEKSITNRESFLKYIEDLPSRHLFVLRNAERLFIKRIGGFEAIKEFMEILTLTNRKVLWIVTFDRYAWSYLKATVGIHDHFEYESVLEELDDTSLRNAIEVRNQISGYNVFYKPTEADLENKAYLKLDEAGRQEMLSERFFKLLKRFCRSSISLALIVWMIAAREKDEETIEVSFIERPDLSFVANLSRVKVFILHLLTLQGSLSIDTMASSLNLDTRTIRMESRSMYEDGILQSEDDVFLINPIIYRYIVQMLREKNLIS